LVFVIIHIRRFRSLIISLCAYGCNESLDVCNPPPDGTPCSDDGNACTNGIYISGCCTHPALADGTGCSDGLYCTGNESCHAGVCLSEAIPACTFGCDEALDACYPWEIPS
jgi:hypothetical protein